jgi:hypothetical protein
VILAIVLVKLIYNVQVVVGLVDVAIATRCTSSRESPGERTMGEVVDEAVGCFGAVVAKNKGDCYVSGTAK